MEINFGIEFIPVRYNLVNFDLKNLGILVYFDNFLGWWVGSGADHNKDHPSPAEAEIRAGLSLAKSKQ